MRVFICCLIGVVVVLVVLPAAQHELLVPRPHELPLGDADALSHASLSRLSEPLPARQEGAAQPLGGKRSSVPDPLERIGYERPLITVTGRELIAMLIRQQEMLPNDTPDAGLLAVHGHLAANPRPTTPFVF